MNSSRVLVAHLVIWLTAPSALMAEEVAPKKETSTITATASSWEQKAHGGWGDMPPERSLDGDLKTAWMAEGDGEWIQYDLGSLQPLKQVKLAFASGDKRVYTFDILTSETGKEKSWTTVSEKLKSGGKTVELEAYDAKVASVRYVRIVGHGNTSEKFPKWCNITEAAFVTK